MPFKPTLGLEHCEGLDCVLRDEHSVRAELQRYKDAGIPVDDYMETWDRTCQMARKIKAMFFPERE
jgi:hypothetical protein